jgi:hypothetical protein
MATLITSTEYLTFDAATPLPAVPLNTPAWKVTDYTSLRRRVRVGEDRPIPGVAGRLHVPREWDALTVALPMKVNGRKDREGNLHADPFVGVEVNHQYLLTNVVNVLDQRAVTFTRRTGSPLTGNVTVQDWEPTADPNSAGDHLICFLTITIAAGWLA